MPVYLDNNATTPILAEVLDAMLPYLQYPAGNPSSVHRFGRSSKEAIEQARQQLADLVDVDASQVIFTSGGTESNNHVIQAVTQNWSGGHLLISDAEHPSIIEPVKAAENESWTVDWVTSETSGLVDLLQLQNNLKPDTRLVSVMQANNETGVIQPVAQVAELVSGKDCWLHTDATQAAGKIELSFNSTGADLMTLSAHKMFGPKGAGALVVNKSIEIQPMIRGGGQERGLRAGTENVAAIVGFGVAAKLAKHQLELRQSQMQQLRDKLEFGLSRIAGVTIFADSVARIGNTSMFAVKGIEGETLLMQLDRQGYAVSSGSACTSSKTEASHVLKSMSVSDELGIGAIRVSIGINNTEAEIDGFLLALREIIAKMLPQFSDAVK